MTGSLQRSFASSKSCYHPLKAKFSVEVYFYSRFSVCLDDNVAGGGQQEDKVDHERPAVGPAEEEDRTVAEVEEDFARHNE